MLYTSFRFQVAFFFDFVNGMRLTQLKGSPYLLLSIPAAIDYLRQREKLASFEGMMAYLHQ